MRFSLKNLLMAWGLCAAISAEAADTGRTFRFYSFMTRDQPPSLQETAAFLAGETTLDAKLDEWLASAEHRERIRRFFRDSWPALAGFTPMWAHDLLTNADGNFYLREKGDCLPEEVVTSEAWWLPAGEVVSICSSSTSDAFKYPGPPVLDCSDYMGGLLEPQCGCGPSLLLCIPLEMRDKLQVDNNNEIPARGLHVYENSLSWFDFFGGDYFYGNRPHYLHYVLSQGQMVQGLVSADAILAELRAIPMEEPKVLSFPAGPPRAGVVTATAFLSDYNTFYSRPRQLSLNMLCQDVDARLNTPPTSTYANKELPSITLAHAGKSGCATCHLALDNHASTLMGYEIWGDINPNVPFPSQAGHAFGETGEGPAFLVRGFVERAEPFAACMAKSAWTSLTGLSWDTALTDTDRQAFTELAAQGPRPLLQGIMRSTALRAGVAP
jgi:hypothetical protein